MTQTIAELKAILGNAPEFSIEDIEPALPLIEVKTELSSATISPFGAQVCKWAPTDHPPVLYLSPKAKLDTSLPIRGGIPICWPWFNKNAENPDLPSHGIARTRFWTLISAETNGRSAKLVFNLTSDEETKKLFPHDFDLTATIHIGDKLRVVLKQKNTGEEPFKVSSALHTYLSVGDTDRIMLEGLKGSHYVDCLLPPDAEEVYQEGALPINEHIDRIYKSMSSVLIRDLDRQRSVFIDKAGSRTTVVWNPWVNQSKKLKDLPDRDYREFLCIEPANAGSDMPTLYPNRSHTLETTIGLRPLT
ncbi:D-hexose-6-phosphate mutarotase [bacterium]|nr:D-hexose-6-phosphate mutarotase [bacterium]MDA7517737.1 D-hexose-6-phosphate mutarotase [Akkermansiaceae bacterium]MDA7518732.1 D-hexose-6-phosphate mutarotase [Akkermansiaceae bacterium]MDA7538639.1 D-hexose-6-phosphate mutarotase [Akkermansiaceae bacterium]MDA7611540.1 D-hexose-6-phosphate mutarotase [bacterium]